MGPKTSKTSMPLVIPLASGCVMVELFPVKYPHECAISDLRALSSRSEAGWAPCEFQVPSRSYFSTMGRRWPRSQACGLAGDWAQSLISPRYVPRSLGVPRSEGKTVDTWAHSEPDTPG